MKNKGISLIVLVVTIIVIVILAGAVILSLSQNNPIKEANEAKFKTNIGDYLSEILLHISDKYAETEGTFKSKELNKDTTNINTVVTIITPNDKERFEIQEGELVYIPGKFTEDEEKWLEDMGIKPKHDVVVPPVEEYPYIPIGFSKSTKTGETDVDTGLVIIDDVNKNEFVWIPVNDFTEFKRETFISWENISNFTEDVTEPELAAIYKSVEKYRGFYIARYEAGIAGETDVQNVDKNLPKDGSILPVSIAGVRPWDYMSWGTASDIQNPGNGAVLLSRKMYQNRSDIKSTLTYGVQWDAALKFIETKYPGYAQRVTDGSSDFAGKLKLTGFNTVNMANNIYDMSGNVWEWTMEMNAYGNGTVVRGGFKTAHRWISGISDQYYYNSYEKYMGGDFGFRPAIYITK